jgi:DNA-binding MurR/RpiR family transcriptional regulator
VTDETALPDLPTGRLLTLLREKMPELRAGERKVAKTVLDQPERVVGLSIIDLAKLSGVSEATVMRLCHALGLRGYTAFKVRLIEELAVSHVAGDQLTAEAFSEVEPDDALPTVIRKVLRMDIQALLDTMSALDHEQISAAIDLLAGARRVGCFGVGGSGPVVEDAAYRFLRVGMDAKASIDSHLQVVHAALLGSEDVALCVSHSGETRDTLDVLLAAKESGARTIALTSFPASPLAQAADVKLLTIAVGSRWRDDAIPARIAQLSLIDALCVAIQLRRGAEAGTLQETISRALRRKSAARS